MNQDGQSPTRSSPKALQRLVEHHQMCWEVWPLRHVQPAGGTRTVGYQLELLGTHYEPAHTPGPGCDECTQVYKALREIAEWIMPKQERDSVYRVGIFDHSMRFSTKRAFRKDVKLIITIQHRTGFTDPLDECEKQCLEEMEHRLRALGARKHHW